MDQIDDTQENPIMDDFDRKYAAATTELADSSIWPSNYNPPILRLARRMGLRMRPPHYATFAQAFVSSAIWFGVIWGLLMWVMFWSGNGMSPMEAAVSAVSAGVMFGLFMAGYYRYSHRKHALTSWDDL